MEKMTNLSLQVETTVKEQAERIFYRLGIPMSTAVNLFLNQVSMTGGIPFEVVLPQVPTSVNADLMTKEEFFSELKEGLEDGRAGRYQDISEFRKEFMEGRGF